MTPYYREGPRDIGRVLPMARSEEPSAANNSPTTTPTSALSLDVSWVPCTRFRSRSHSRRTLRVYHGVVRFLRSTEMLGGRAHCQCLLRSTSCAERRPPTAPASPVPTASNIAP